MVLSYRPNVFKVYLKYERIVNNVKINPPVSFKTDKSSMDAKLLCLSQDRNAGL
jgi:hypothetical protein